MSDTSTRYWKSLAEREGGPEFEARAGTEFAATPLDTASAESRRGFLRAAGFTFAGAMLSSCTRAPQEKALPLLHQPEGIVPGSSSFYASTCAGCQAACGILAKVRDGRPIKLEGNPEHPWSRGGLCAAGQASILSLYDSHRLGAPLSGGQPSDWKTADQAILAALQTASRSGGVRVLSATVTSPTLQAAISKFLSRFPDARHVVYDTLSGSAIPDAHERTHGARVLPHYRFDKADVIVSIDADFLGAWISPVEFTAAYSAARAPETAAKGTSWHGQFEARMSVTGAKADRRVRVAPELLGLVVEQLAARVARHAGAATAVVERPVEGVSASALDDSAGRLWNSRGRSLVVCGINDTGTQVLVNYLNQLLGNYGTAIEIDRPSFQRQGNDRDLESLLAELGAGKVSALFVLGVNPVYDLPQGESLAEAIRRLPLSVSLALRPDETSEVCGFVCPDLDPLESWSDAEAVSGIVSLAQPAVRPLTGARQALESFAAWSGAPAGAYDLVRAAWQSTIYPRQAGTAPFESFWQKSLHDGFAEVRPRPVTSKNFDAAAVKPLDAPARPGEFTLVLYPKPSILDGRHAHNPWLQELPDPISKACWDNYACLSPAAAGRLGVKDGDVVRLSAGGVALSLPALIQPGQHDEAVAVALGYGRKASQRFAQLGPRWLSSRPAVGPNGMVGSRAAPLLRLAGGNLANWRTGVSVAPTGERFPLAITQDHHSLTVPKHLDPGTGPRPIIQEISAAGLQSTAAARADGHAAPERDLWPDDHPFRGHRWAMVVDLNACTGCAACVVACQVENNVPVVGKDEVIRNREMHWIRVDRYYSGETGDVHVAHQPMMCQQCEHAPCETVCPVLATVHSEEGLNQQVYNRCVGTRYCANNCPYKTRRFNWFDYRREDRLANMVLNPDVAVRTRGVMEKCSFCVQRIQDARIEAKAGGKPLADGDIRTACQQSCPAAAITFGDWNDPKSRVARLMKSKRRYRVLEELNVRPSVGYLKLVRDQPEGEGGEHRG